MENEATNESTPQGQVEESAKGVEQSAPANASETAIQSKAPADTTVPAVTEFDARQSYDRLQAELQKRDKSYLELRREFTRRTQNEADLQKKIDNLMAIVSKAAEVPIDPEAFFKDFQTQPLKALEPILTKEREAMKSEYSKQMEEVQSRLTASEYRAEKFARILDAENYPDYKKLEPIMGQLIDDPNTPIDFDRSPGEVLDALYKLARTLSMEDAVKQAKTMGRQEAETQLAKEAATSVAPGGKAGTQLNPAKMGEKQLRQYFIDRGMVEGY